MDDTARQKAIVEEARQFADKSIRPRAGEIDQLEELPRDLIADMMERRYHVASLPEGYGGLGLDPVYYGFLTEEIGKACCSTRALMTVQSSLVGETLVKWGTGLQKDRWLRTMASGECIGAFALSEPETGSDARGVRTVYEDIGGEYVLNGRKSWTSFGDVADFFIIIAACEGDLTAFIVGRENEGLTSRPIRGLLAGRACHLAQLDLHDVRIPHENVIGRPGCGFRYVVGTALDHGRYSVAWAGVAVAQEAVDAMVTYSRKRKQFGKRICEFQLIEGLIGDAVTDTHAARALCVRAGELRKDGDKAAVMETAIAKYFTSKVAVQVTNAAVQVHGGVGCTNAYPVGRLYREAKVLEIIEGTSQIHQRMIARYGLRKYYKADRGGQLPPQ